MTKNIKPLNFVVTPPKEIDIEPYKDILREYQETHPDCTIIKIRKKVPQSIEGLVLEIGLTDPLSENISDRYKSVAEELANLTHQKVTLIPTEIGFTCSPA